MPVNTDREDLALDMERIARDLDRLRRRHAGSLHGRFAADVDDLFAEAFAFAHRVGPEVVGPVPSWLTPDEAQADARRLARRLGGIPELLASAGPRRRPRRKVIRGGAEPKRAARGSDRP